MESVKKETINELEEKVKVATTEDDENLRKVVSPEAVFEIPVGNGKRKKVFWTRIGFSSRIYFKSFFKKKLKEAIESGLFGIEGRFKGTPNGVVDGKNTMFKPEPSSLDEKSLKVYEGSTQQKPSEVSYSDDLRVLLFNKAPVNDVTVEYDYYDTQLYQQLYNDSFVTVLIYLCAKEIDNHGERVFKTIEEIGQLTMMDINEIIGLYTQTTPFGDLQSDPDKIKNSHTPLPTSEEGVTQNAGTSIPGEQRSGDSVQDTTEKKV